MPRFKPFAEQIRADDGKHPGKWVARNLWRRELPNATEEWIESFEPFFDTEAEAVNFARLRGLNSGTLME